MWNKRKYEDNIQKSNINLDDEQRAKDAAKEEEFSAIAGIFEEVRNYMGFLAVQGQMKRSTEQRMIQQKEMEMTLHGQTNVGQIEQAEHLPPSSCGQLCPWQFRPE